MLICSSKGDGDKWKELRWKKLGICSKDVTRKTKGILQSLIISFWFTNLMQGVTKRQRCITRISNSVCSITK